MRLMENYFDHLLSLDTPTYTVAHIAKRFEPSTVLWAFHTVQPSSLCFVISRRIHFRRRRRNLSGSEAAECRQAALRGRVWVRIGAVPVTQDVPGRLVEAVRPARLLLLLVVVVGADRRRQRMSLADTVLVDGAQRTSALTLRLLVVSFVPERLQPRLTVRTEPAMCMYVMLRSIELVNS